MDRKIITINENDIVHIPYDDIWMSEQELVTLFQIIVPTLRASIKAIYKNNICNPMSCQCDCRINGNYWIECYNLTIIVALAFRLNTRQADMVREALLKRITQTQNEKISIFLTIPPNGTSCS